MKIYIAVLIFFLAAFAGLAVGLLLKRKGPRGGCSPHPHDKNCYCKSTTDSIKKNADEYQKGDTTPKKS